jgi:hypothetical protein
MNSCSICGASAGLEWVDSGLGDGGGGYWCADRRACSLREHVARLMPGLARLSAAMRAACDAAMKTMVSLAGLLPASKPDA